MRTAIERVDNDESYRSVAADTPNLNHVTLMDIHKDEDRRSWYLDGEADDTRAFTKCLRTRAVDSEVLSPQQQPLYHSATKRSAMSQEDPPVAIGTTVYTDEGEQLGTVRGFDTDGFFVTTREGIESLSVEHRRAGHGFGKAELMWRCSDCGEMGELNNGVPDTCPNCEGPREHLYYWTED
jgi:hypothetical protein